MKLKRIKGIINVTNRGKGYVSHEHFKEDIEIEQHFLKTALNGDTVEVITHPKPEGKGRRVTGEVVNIIKRAKEFFVGVIEKKDGSYFLVPDNRRIYVDIFIPEIDKTVMAGTKVLVKMNEWTDARKNPEGIIVKILGPKGLHEVEMESIVLEHGFDTTFPSDVEKQAKKIENNKLITKKEIVNRRDFREITTFTIDPESAKDFDDALSIQELSDGNIEVGIHIADVSYYVRPGSAIDGEARNRGTSIYLVDRTIPMLPEILSNDVCSLNPNEDKLTFSAIFTLSKNGDVLGEWFGETIIHSGKRFTYEEAQKIIDSGKGKFHKELVILNDIAKKMRKKRIEEGSILFEQEEVRFKLDEEGHPISVYKKKLLDTNLLIEDFMLLANRKVAEYFYKIFNKTKRRDITFVYRIHDVPNREKIEELAIFLKAIGHELKETKGEISAKEINKLFKQIKGTPEESLIKTATIRSMAKAVYSTKNIGHFGLSFKYYTHFTSPIRRYPDLMVHRILKSHLRGGTPIGEDELKQYEKLVITSSQREIAAVEAERDSIKYKQVEYMKEKVGEEFDGVISGVTQWGIYVEENNTKAEGLVRLRSLKDDYYILDRKHYRIVGEKTKKKYSLGDRVKIKLTGADLEAKTLDFELVS